MRAVTTLGRWIPHPEVSTFALDDDLVLFDERSGEVHVLNASAARIWTLCDGTRTIRDVACALASGCGIGYRRALTDVRALLTSAQQADLLIERMA